jgi:hypothetical protein
METNNKSMAALMGKNRDNTGTKKYKAIGKHIINPPNIIPAK